MEQKNRNIKLTEGVNGNPFRVPEGYFEKMPRRIFDRIEAQAPSSKDISHMRYLKPVLKIAASFAVIFCSIFIPYKLFFNAPTEQSAFNDMEYYLSRSIDEHKIFETIESDSLDVAVLFDNDQLENVLLSSLNEYELIVLNN